MDDPFADFVDEQPRGAGFGVSPPARSRSQMAWGAGLSALFGSPWGRVFADYIFRPRPQQPRSEFRWGGDQPAAQSPSGFGWDGGPGQFQPAAPARPAPQQRDPWWQPRPRPANAPMFSWGGSSQRQPSYFPSRRFSALPTPQAPQRPKTPGVGSPFINSEFRRDVGLE